MANVKVVLKQTKKHSDKTNRQTGQNNVISEGHKSQIMDILYCQHTHQMLISMFMQLGA